MNIELTKEELLAWEHSTPDPERAIRLLVAQATNVRVKRMVQDAVEVFKNDGAVDVMPASDSGMINALVARDDYKRQV